MRFIDRDQIDTERLEKLSNARYREALRRAAHSVKSSTGMLGLTHVSTLMRTIEHGAAELPLPELEGLIERAAQEYDRAEVTLDEMELTGAMAAAGAGRGSR